MIVIGADTHKQSHTAGAVDAATGRVAADKTVKAKRRSFDDLLVWARGLDAERVWTIEDCRHVSGALERFLLKHGEQVVRVAPKLAAGARSAARERGKSDIIDAVSIARAALREGLDTLPIAKLAEPELDVRLLVDHRERLVAQRTQLINDLRWHLHDLWPELEIPARVLITTRWQDRIGARLAVGSQIGPRAVAIAAQLNKELGVSMSKVARSLSCSASPSLRAVCITRSVGSRRRPSRPAGRSCSRSARARRSPPTRPVGASPAGVGGCGCSSATTASRCT